MRSAGRDLLSTINFMDTFSLRYSEVILANEGLCSIFLLSPIFELCILGEVKCILAQ